jgi:hypothetical protein
MRNTMNEFSQVDELTISITPCQIAIAGLGFACVLCAVMAKMQEELKPNGLRSGLCFASQRHFPVENSGSVPRAGSRDIFLW